jgi:hypothetical protein
MIVGGEVRNWIISIGNVLVQGWTLYLSSIFLNVKEFPDDILHMLWFPVYK